MKLQLFFIFILTPSLLLAQAKVKFVNVPSTELDYPMLTFNEDIKSYSIHVHLHDFIDDYDWSETKVKEGIEPLRNYSLVDDNSDLYIHLDYYIQKEMETGGEVINAPVKLTLIDGAGNSFYNDFVLSNNKAAQVTASSTHPQIVEQVKSHLQNSVSKANSYISKLFDGEEFTVGANTAFFTVKKASDADQKKFDEAIELIKDKIISKVVTGKVLDECSPAIDFWKSGMDTYDKSSAEYLVCGANLFYLSLKSNNPKLAQSYFDSVKGIKNAWTPKENILNDELKASEKASYHDIKSFAEGGKSASAGDSESMQSTGKLKLESGDIVEGKITFSQNQDGEFDGVVVFKSLNDSQKYGLHQIKGGVFNDTRFVKVETRMGDELYEIVEAAGHWQVIRPLGDSGTSLLAIGNSKTEKSYHFTGEIKMNAKFGELFKSCNAVVKGAEAKKYGRKMDHFVALIKDLDSCN